MNGKWHINKKGVPSVCKANKGKCPLGEHFDNKEQAMKSAEEQLAREYGILPMSKSEIEKRKDFASLISRVSGTNSPGFEYECYASLTLAEEMGLDKVAITDENGLTINLSTKNEDNQINAKVFVNESVNALSNYYEKMGIAIKNKTALARVVYHSDDIEKGVLVQSGGPNVLDAAIIKANEVVDIIEVKELGRGAQLPSISLNVDKYGSLTEESIESQSEYLQKAIKDIKIQDADGKDVQLDFGNEEDNKVIPLQHFIDQYKKKGATAFIYTTNDGETVNKIDLTGPNEEVLEKLVKNKIEANITMRANLNKQNVTEEDIYRFNHVLSKQYFKSGRSSTTETFTLKGIKEDKITKAGKYVRVGGYILPIEYDSYKENLFKRINKKDMKAFRLVLAGNIKTNY